MKETKHTPGPWRADIDFSPIIWARTNRGDMRVADVRGWGHLTGIGGMKLPEESAAAIQTANAHLIAAAPDLLEACGYMLTLLRGMGHGGLAGAILGENAIAKAEGLNGLSREMGK